MQFGAGMASVVSTMMRLSSITIAMSVAPLSIAAVSLVMASISTVTYSRLDIIVRWGGGMVWSNYWLLNDDCRSHTRAMAYNMTLAIASVEA